MGLILRRSPVLTPAPIGPLVSFKEVLRGWACVVIYALKSLEYGMEERDRRRQKRCEYNSDIIEPGIYPPVNLALEEPAAMSEVYRWG